MRWSETVKIKLTGSVHYANGDPIAGVAVCIYDQDTAGKQDDDLTLTPGLTDARGRFKLTYTPLRYLDYHTISRNGVPEGPFDQPSSHSGLRLPDVGDIYQPYLRFNYTFNGLNRQHTAPLGLLQRKFYLPENPPLEFVPSQHGFRFTNSFSGYFLPFSPPAFMGRRKVSSKYGLCGGMCSAAYDFALAQKSIPGQQKVPRQGTRLQRYLFQRQMDSLGGVGKQVIKVAQWTGMPDDTLAGTYAQTAAELRQLLPRLEDRNPVLLALINERATNLRQLARLIFNNHQVLAYAFRREDRGAVTLNVYDPNLPTRDDVTIRCEPVSVGQVDMPEGALPVMGVKSVQFVGDEFYRNVRGFFSMPYEPVRPPRVK